MNYKKFMILFFLALPVRLAKLINSKEYSTAAVGIAIVAAAFIAAFWSIIAGWLRMKFSINLPEAYINKI